MPVFNRETRVVEVQLIFVFVGFQKSMKYELFPLISGIQNDFGKLLNKLATLGAKFSRAL